MINLWRTIQNTPGAVAITEMVGLYNTILDNLNCSNGIAADLGSNAGKSSLAASVALSKLGRNDEFHLVDPIYDLTNQAEWAKTVQKTSDKMPWGFCRRETFQKDLLNKLEKFSSLEHILYGITSLTYLETIRSYSYVFIDSDDHQFELVMWEARRILEQVKIGGLVFFHDFEGNYPTPGMAYEYMIDVGMYKPIEIDWGKAIDYVNKYDLERENDSWHFPNLTNPTFLGCLKRVK